MSRGKLGRRAYNDSLAAPRQGQSCIAPRWGETKVRATRRCAIFHREASTIPANSPCSSRAGEIWRSDSSNSLSRRLSRALAWWLLWRAACSFKVRSGRRRRNLEDPSRSNCGLQRLERALRNRRTFLAATPGPTNQVATKGHGLPCPFRFFSVNPLPNRVACLWFRAGAKPAGRRRRMRRPAGRTRRPVRRGEPVRPRRREPRLRSRGRCCK